MKRNFIFLLAITVTSSSCKKLVEVEVPKNKISQALVFSDDATATAATIALYEQMMEGIANFGNGGITLLCGLSSDELKPSSNTSYGEFFNSAVKIGRASCRERV